MTAPGTAVTTTDGKRRAISPEHQQIIEENRARNAVIAQIRGTIWGREVSGETARAVAQYCRENQLDAVRHVEVLGGRIYLTAEFYDERGAQLLRDGVIIPAEPDYINADPRLDELAKKGEDWALLENTRRIRERIKWAVPESAKAAVVQRFIIAETGKAVVGVNWCGQQGGKKDPVGDAEPAKTAQTRARRRAWKQIADVIPGYAAVVRPIEERARAVAPILTVEAPSGLLPQGTKGVIQNGGYEVEPTAEHGEDGRPVPRETVATNEPAPIPSGQPTSAEEVFGDTRPEIDAADVDTDIVTQMALTSAGQWEVPAGELRGRLLGHLTNDQLLALKDALSGLKKYLGTIDQIDELLEERRTHQEG